MSQKAGTNVASSLFRLYHSESKDAQKAILRDLIHDHEVAVQKNAIGDVKNSFSTYIEKECLFFSEYNLAVVPSTSGVHRADIRSALGSAETLGPLQQKIMEAWHSSPRQAVLFGCNSVRYAERLLRQNRDHSLLVIDHSLKSLANASSQLYPTYKSRITFMRSDAMFASLTILPEESTDLVIAPMPPPFRSQKSSYRRLVNCDFFNAAHLNIRPREGPEDARGIVTFTDSRPFAKFILEQLEESKLIVPWKQKNPNVTFAQWIAEGNTSDEEEESNSRKEFVKQRFPDTISIAASKTESASAQAKQLIRLFDYKRRYYSALDDYMEGE